MKLEKLPVPETEGQCLVYDPLTKQRCTVSRGHGGRHYIGDVWVSAAEPQPTPSTARCEIHKILGLDVLAKWRVESSDALLIYSLEFTCNEHLPSTIHAVLARVAMSPSNRSYQDRRKAHVEVYPALDWPEEL